MNNHFIGIDIGTTAIKVAAMNDSGQAVAEKQYSYDYLIPQDGWTEIDPDTWFAITMQGLKELLQEIPTETVKGIGVTGQMHTTVFIDKHGFSIRPAIMWNDHRTIKMVPELKAMLRDQGLMSAAKIVSTGSPLTSLLWLREFEAENYASLDKFLIAKDYLNYRLTGQIATDYCDASTSALYDFAEDEWSMPLQAFLGLSQDLFPPIKPAATVIGTLKEEVQLELGLSPEVKVVTGTGDNVASALASGALNDEQPLLSLGTSGVVVIPNRRHQLKAVGKNVVAKLTPEDPSIITQGTVQAGAKVNSWWLEEIIGSADFQREQEQISQDLQKNSQLLFIPHLNGEKTLFADPHLRGAFVGLSLETTRAEMYLAVLEGLAFGMRQLFESMENEQAPKFFRIVGGGSKSPLWQQLFADILGYPIRRRKLATEAVHGACRLAMIGADFDTLADGGELLEKTPRPEYRQHYEEKYKRYLLLNQMLLEFTQEGASS